MYTTLLAFLSICLGSVFSAICDSHITPLLLLSLLVDIWVQIFPGHEMSKATLICDWIRIGFLVIASLILPALAWSSSPKNKYKPPPLNWPTSGRLVVQKLSAQYSDQEPPTIEDLSFRAEAGERIGVVGKLASQYSPDVYCKSVFFSRVLNGETRWEGRLGIGAVKVHSHRGQRLL
jgi:ABC-type multidrug transport system fused ATPase/permease subunit